MCGGDVASHKFPLFRCKAAHMTICGYGLWWAVADPHHSTAWFCVEEPRTRVTVAELGAHVASLTPDTLPYTLIPNAGEAANHIFLFATLQNRDY